MVEAVEAAKDIGSERGAIVGDERPLDAVDLERREVVWSEHRGAVRAAHVARDTDAKGLDPVGRHTVCSILSDERRSAHRSANCLSGRVRQGGVRGEGVILA